LSLPTEVEQISATRHHIKACHSETTPEAAHYNNALCSQCFTLFNTTAQTGLSNQVHTLTYADIIYTQAVVDAQLQ